MTNATSIIDIHSHAILPIGRGAPLGSADQPHWSMEGAIAYMDEHSVSACVLSVPDAANYDAGRAGREIARRVNEALAEVVSSHPDRFGALATVPGLDPEGAVAEIAYALDTLGFEGVSTSTSIGGAYLGEPRFDPWFEDLDRRSATLFIHPSISDAGQALLLGLNPSVIEFMFETTRMIANMVATGAKRRFGQVRMISTHAGGTMPFLARRFATLECTFGVGPGRLQLSAEEALEAISSFHFDLTAATSEAQLEALRLLVPSSQILMGLDYPFMPADSFGPAIADLQRYAPWDADDRHAVAFGNAAELFPALAKRIARAQ